MDTLRVIEEEPERLQTLKGLTAKRAMELSAAFRALTGLRQVMEFLARYELPVHLAMAVQRTYGDGAMQALRDDPYLLSREQYGVDFAVTDAIALSMGFSGDDPCRLDAAVLYELSYNLHNGHVFLPREKLIQATAQLIGVEPDAVELALDKLIQRFAVVEKPIANVTGCYLPRLYQAETFVAQRLLEMVKTPVEQLSRVDKTIADIEQEQGVSYAPLQRQAVALAADSGVLLLTGGPGTGKTTSLRGIVTLYERMELDVLLLAPTGPGRQAAWRGDGPGGPDHPPVSGHELQRSDGTGDVQEERQGSAGCPRRHRGRDEHGGSGADAGAAGGAAALLPPCDGGRPRPAALRGRGQRAGGHAAQRGHSRRVPDAGVPAGGAVRHHPQRPQRQRGTAAVP